MLETVLFVMRIMMDVLDDRFRNVTKIVKKWFCIHDVWIGTV